MAAATARAREIAGDKHVVIASADITQQALGLGLVDEVCVRLVPVLFGEGIPYFGKLGGAPAARRPGGGAGPPGDAPALPGPSLSGIIRAGRRRHVRPVAGTAAAGRR
ncbi:MAG TPA: hypothetical protein VK020_15835 [Microlunatus sp.]|nr:hypothetical protein [Microlunatus sp.]